VGTVQAQRAELMAVLAVKMTALRRVGEHGVHEVDQQRLRYGRCLGLLVLVLRRETQDHKIF
jgi:hypothetical protein